MMLLGTKMCLALLWGIAVFFAMESTSAPILETSTIDSTAEPHEPHTEPHKAAGISAATAAETTGPPASETEKAIVTHRSDSANGSASDLVAMNTVATTTSSTNPQLLHTATAATAAAAHPSHNMTISETATPTEDHIHQPSPTTPTDMTAPATASEATSAAASATVAGSSLQPTSAIKPEVTSKLSPTTFPANSTQAPAFIQTLSSPSASATTTVTANPTSEAAPVFVPTLSETSTTSTDLLSKSEHVSSTRTLISTTQFPDTAGSRSTALLSTDSAISTTNVSTSNVSTTVSPTNVSPTNVSTTVSPTNVSTTNVSTSPAAILIPHATTRLPVPTTKSTPATTTAPCGASKTPPSTEVQPCSIRGVAKHCLIAIASLAALATAFMVSTIILCTRLSARKYKVKKPQPATEMMCISALLPERNYTYTRQRTPVTNGVLVIHGGADSDDDGGDNLTLSSFLPENDRYV